MILYEVLPNKTLKIREDEKTYITENLISSVHIKLPSTFGDYPVKELTAELRFYFPEGDYMAYAVDTQQARPEVPITNDITEKPQTLSVMLFFYKGGNVIGKTNSVDKVILDAPLKGEPLTPRAEFDEVIAEQRETMAEQAETITEQAGTISSQGEQITELSGEVTELTTENTRLEALTETQRETIQYMVDNPPALEYPENPIIPTRQAQTIRPTPPFYGIGRLEVDGYTPNNQNKIVTPSTTEQTVTAGEIYDGLGVVKVEPTPLESKRITPTSEEMTYTPTAPNIGFSSVTVEGMIIPFGGIYFTKLDENNAPVDIMVVNYDFKNTNFSLLGIRGIDIETIIFQNCKNYKIANEYFNGSTKLKTAMFDGIVETGINSFMNCVNLIEVRLSDEISVLGTNTFYGCRNLSVINLPASLTTIMVQVFLSCSSLENVTIENGFNANGLRLDSSTLYSVETIVSWLEALADRTGETAYTLTMGTTNLNKLTNEQKAIAINKNWNLA